MLKVNYISKKLGEEKDVIFKERIEGNRGDERQWEPPVHRYDGGRR